MRKFNSELYLSSVFKQPFKFYDEYIGKLKWWQMAIIRLDVLFHREKLFIIPSDEVKEIKTINFKNGSSIMIIPTNMANENVRGMRSKMSMIDWL